MRYFDLREEKVHDSWMPKSSIYEVAALAGVSIATVSRTMNQAHRVSEQTRSRVMEAVHKLGYVPDFEAAARARHHNDRIVAIAPLNTYPGFVQRLRGISLALEESQAELIIFQVDPKKLSNPQNVKFIDSLASSGRYDGLIIMSITISDQDLTRISETHFPTVLIETTDSRFPSFGVNNQDGAAMAVSHLIEKGFKNIGFVGFNPIESYSINASKIREQGYIYTLLQNGRTVNPEHLIFCEYSIEDTYQAALQMLKKRNRPDALFCASDLNALGVLKAARELKLEVPTDLAVVGFDDIEVADYLELTTIKQPLEGSGRQAAMLINKLIKDPTSTKAIQIDLPLQLIERSSS